MPSVDSGCIACRQDPCVCKCAKCGVGDESSYYPADGKLERVSNLTFDTYPMEGADLDPKLAKQGWRHEVINEHHLRYRVTCRDCLNKMEQAREVWVGINKERESIDSSAKVPDQYYGLLVDAEIADPEDTNNYWGLFTDS